MKKKFLIVGIALMVFITVVGGLIFFAFKGIGSRPPTASEKTMLLTAESLADFGFTNLLAECETYLAKRNLDGTPELEYEYDSEKAPDQERLFISSGVGLEPSPEDASTSFKIFVTTLKGTIKISSKAELQDRPDLFTLGDERYSALIVSNGEPQGNLVAVRSGRIIHHAIITGIYFEEREYLEKLFAPILSLSSPDKFE
ncbi:MAG: hypothetical protein JXR40_03005 [Pontiellaceae bacterium]|nr:hypothetical protein [Pontiellaceae bacterium]